MGHEIHYSVTNAWCYIPIRPRLAFSLTMPTCKTNHSLMTDTNSIFHVLVCKGFSNCSSTASKTQETKHYKIARLRTKLKNSQETKLFYTAIIKSKIKMSVFTSISSQHSSKAVEIWDNIIHKKKKKKNHHTYVFL